MQVSPAVTAGPPFSRTGNSRVETDAIVVSKCLHASRMNQQNPEHETFVVTGTLQHNKKAAGSATTQDAEAGLLVVSRPLLARHDSPEDGSGRQTLAIAFHGSQDPDVSGDVTHPVGRNQGQEVCVLTGQSVRRLTPRECERLQGFPDDYTLITYRGKPAKDGPRYRVIGNSMAVPVMRWIGERIEAVSSLGKK